MAKRVLILSSSPRRGGNSDRLCDEFLRGAAEAGHDAATPVYFYTMAAQMKTLIDRCCARYTEISGKEFYLLLTAAEEEREKMLRTADTFQGFFDCLEEPHLRATVFGTGVWHAGEIAGHPALREAYEAGKGI